MGDGRTDNVFLPFSRPTPNGTVFTHACNALSALAGEGLQLNMGTGSFRKPFFWGGFETGTERY